MKVEVKANDFCPDNCPYCDIDKIEAIYGLQRKVIFECRYLEICKYGAEAAKRKFAENSCNL